MDDAVVVGYDRSQPGSTLAEAARTAVRRGVPLVIVNAYPGPIPAAATLPLPSTEDWPPLDLAESANELVGQGVDMARSWYPELRIDGRVVAGHAWEVLGEASEDAALLVVGRHGEEALTDDTLGTVTLRVLADSACPVVVVPAGRPADGGPVVAAVDLDTPCDKVLDFAFAEAARRGVPLEAVYVREEPWSVLRLHHTDESAQKVTSVEENLRARLAALLREAGVRHPDVDPAGRVVTGPAAKTLIEATGSAGLIVVGARRRGRRRRHRQQIGPVVHRLLHHARCPVAVVPFDGPPEPSGAEAVRP